MYLNFLASILGASWQSWQRPLYGLLLLALLGSTFGLLSFVAAARRHTRSTASTADNLDTVEPSAQDPSPPAERQIPTIEGLLPAMEAGTVRGMIRRTGKAALITVGLIAPFISFDLGTRHGYAQRDAEAYSHQKTIRDYWIDRISDPTHYLLRRIDTGNAYYVEWCSPPGLVEHSTIVAAVVERMDSGCLNIFGPHFELQVDKDTKGNPIIRDILFAKGDIR